MEQIENKMVLDDYNEVRMPMGCCAECGEDFYEGDECFSIGGDIYCLDCFEDLMLNNFRFQMVVPED